MNPLLPVRPATVPQSQLELKLDQANHPLKYGMTLNDEGRRFLQATLAGFLPIEPDRLAFGTLEGYGTFLYWLGAGGQEKVAAGLYDWIAWNDKFDGVPVEAARSKTGNWHASKMLWEAAIDRQYGMAGSIKPITATTFPPAAEQAPPGKTVWDVLYERQGTVNMPPVSSPSATLTELRNLVSYATANPPNLWGDQALLWLLRQELDKEERLARDLETFADNRNG